MHKSMVVDSTTGQEIADSARTSTGTFFQIGQTDVLTRIEQRVARITMIPVGGYFAFSTTRHDLCSLTDDLHCFTTLWLLTASSMMQAGPYQSAIC